MEHTAPCSRVCSSACLLSVVPQAAAAASVFTARPDDPAAVHVDVPAAQPADADHTALLQAALDRAAASPAGGIVLVPSGRYRVTRTLIVWRAVRVIGYGATRPVFVLPERTPGFQTGLGVMMHFTNARPRHRRPGQPAAGGVPAARLRAGERDHPRRQPDDLLLVDDERRLRDRRRQPGRGRGPLPRRAARHPERHRLPHRVRARRHHRGRQRRPEPALPGRPLRHHGHEHVAVLALHADRLGVRGPARGGHPRAPDRPDRGAHDVPQRAGRDQHRQGLLGQPVAEGRAVREASPPPPSSSTSRRTRSPRSAPRASSASTRRSSRASARASHSRRRERRRRPTASARFHHGLFVRGSDSTGRIDEQYDAEPLAAAPAPLPPALPALPPMEQWVNVRTLGVKGDGKTDDTKALQAAIDGTRVLYFPSGTYVVRDTIALKPDTALIALHPATTRIDLADRVEAFAGVGEPKALLQAPQGGRTIVSGLGVFPGATNPRATAVLWMAGPRVVSQRRHDPLVRAWPARPGRPRPLRRAVPERLGHEGRRRDVPHHLERRAQRAVGLLRVRHDDAAASSTSCRPSITSTARSSWIASRTGSSTRRRPRRRCRRAPRPSPSRSTTRRTSRSRTIAPTA